MPPLKLSTWFIACFTHVWKKCYSRALRANLRLLWLWWLKLQGITGNQEYHITIIYIYIYVICIYVYIYIYMNTYIIYTYVTIYCGKGGGQVSICDWSLGVARMFCACGTDLGILLDVLCCIYSSLLSKWHYHFFP